MQEQENLSLYDSVTPGLQPGAWQIRTFQKLYRDGQEMMTEEISAQQSILVGDPLFSVDGESAVQRIPLPDSQGCYTDVIPHLVLKGVKGFGRAGFALLLLKEKEIAGCVQETTVGEYLKEKEKVFIPPVACVGEDTLLQPCICLRLSMNMFQMVAPEESELPYLTHYRQVYIGNKPEMGLDEDGMFTVVISNRIPQYEEGFRTAYQVHLVSLAQVYPYLGSNSEKFSYVDLISIERWSFSVTGKKPDSFRKICQRLNTEGSISDMLFKLPVKEGMETVEGRLSEGFVPMLYHTRTGDEGLCWNRSPFTPLKVERTDRIPFETADSALCYDSRDGVFDVSMAAAFEAGRMAALQDGAYLDSLLCLRREAQRLTDRMLAKELSGFEENETFRGAVSKALVKTDFGEADFGKADFEKDAASVRVTAIPRFPEQTKEEVELVMNREMERLMPLLDECGRPVAKWLSKLLLFYPLSYDCLVPHEALLPRESVRFFFVDESWRQALFDGAVSIGLYSQRQSLFNRLMRTYLYQASEKAALAYRAELYGEKVPQGRGVLSGFLVRAGMVSYWPSVSVEARDGQKNKLAILRMEHLAPDVLLAIFDGIADQVVVNEPEEGLALKIDTEVYPALKGDSGVLCLSPDIKNNLVSMIAQKQSCPVKDIGPAALARCFLTTGERTIFGGVKG